jgi:paraquat-inducible protein A
MTFALGNPDRQASLDDLVACPGCDLLHNRRTLKVGEFARCDRCGDVLQTNKFQSIDRSLATVLASIVMLLVSLSLPFLSLSRAGVNSTISVLDAVASLWLSDMLWLGMLTLAFIVLLPMARLLLLAWVLGRIRFRRKIRRSMRMAFRWTIRLEPWAMADIFMVGVVVSLVKISTLANLHTGLAFWSLLMLVGLSIYLNLTLCKDTIWAVLTHKV